MLPFLRVIRRGCWGVSMTKGRPTIDKLQREQSTILGIDIGSVTVGIVELDRDSNVLSSDYRYHFGNPLLALRDAIKPDSLKRVRWIASTSSSPQLSIPAISFDTQLSLIAAGKHLVPKVGAIVSVGGERFSLIRFDDQGNYKDSKMNSACAAGTGSFLDQQARRLGLSDTASLAAAAAKARGPMPTIASRCAVFAKTDLLHAQQEGYQLEDICDGLCHGLAKNIADTLFSCDDVRQPIIFAGGVSLNKAVRNHLESIANIRFLEIPHAHVFGAFGAALLLHEQMLSIGRGHARKIPELKTSDLSNLALSTTLDDQENERFYEYEPLELRLSNYPDFRGSRHFEFWPQVVQSRYSVEVDLYDLTSSDNLVLGIDIGSTSSKAIVITPSRDVIAGFYTRTAGQPLVAVQSLFEAIAACIPDTPTGHSVSQRIKHVGTTGAGRKFIGSIIGADLIVDEITAHGVAASQLNPLTDTIIEIGGQDAKFTTLRNGAVTSSVMNFVCAAGTGSFIEEQAQKLGCPLENYSSLAQGVRAPAASDCCTVFMEKDVNEHLRNGFSREEVLATILHSVRENYIRKVVGHNKFGDHICFQGATAKNKALVAAFEQKLGKQIYVSKYCHLTGALGVASMLASKTDTTSRFRGLSLFKKEIPLNNELCTLCSNKCKIRVASVEGETVAFGFQCGRDYSSKRFVSANQSGFDLAKTRKESFPLPRPVNFKYPITIGIPAALYLYEDLPFWEHFFGSLGIKVKTSVQFKDAVALGKRLAGAEFCSPIAAFHGHAAYLADTTDYVFVPVYLDEPSREKGTRRQYCYYSQFISSLVATSGHTELKRKCLSPLLNYDHHALNAKIQLYQCLKGILDPAPSFLEIYTAYDQAWYAAEDSRNRLRGMAQLEAKENSSHAGDDIGVVLIGRPYTVLPPQMNKGIPDILANLGVKAFFQDMLSYTKEDLVNIQDILKTGHWRYASQILEAAEVTAKTPGLYPVLVTAFKCAPDSCTIDTFKQIVESHDKPYLILQLDEHDSPVGYETRIEAGVRAFRNHFRTKSEASRPARLPALRQEGLSLQGKTLLLPNWDSISCQFIVNNLVREGIDARLLSEDTSSIQRSLLNNTGQCIPLTCIAQNFIDYVNVHGLDPAKTVLWVMNAQVACNIGQFPYTIKNLLNRHGNGFEQASVYAGAISFSDFSMQAALNAYLAFLIGGVLRKLACKIRPYEKRAGDTDRALEASTTLFNAAFLGKTSKLDTLHAAAQLFESVQTTPQVKPKVALFGDIYVIDNEVMNQQIVRYIEDHGGEVVVTPYTESCKLVAKSYFRRWLREGSYADVVTGQTILAAAKLLEKRYLQKLEPLLGTDLNTKPSRDPAEILKIFNINPYNTGESFDNIIKMMHLVENYPDLSLFVQLNPSYCCPSLVTEAMTKEIERVTGVPVVSITYDGTASPKNDVILPYLRYPRRRQSVRPLEYQAEAQQS